MGHIVSNLALENDAMKELIEKNSWRTYRCRPTKEPPSACGSGRTFGTRKPASPQLAESIPKRVDAVEKGAGMYSDSGTCMNVDDFTVFSAPTQAWDVR